MYFVSVSSMSSGRDYNRTTMMKLSPIAVMAGLFLVAAGTRAASAHDFVRGSPPHRWVEALVPEDLPPLKYPAYFNDIDKARAQLHHGRYKLALVTLRKAKDVDPAEAARSEERRVGKECRARAAADR